MLFKEHIGFVIGVLILGYSVFYGMWGRLVFSGEMYGVGTVNKE